MRLLFLLLVACNSESPVMPDAGPSCTQATMYMGEPIECDGGQGICIAYGPDIRCQAKCSDTGGACTDGHWWRTILLASGVSACYCEPH